MKNVSFFSIKEKGNSKKGFYFFKKIVNYVHVIEKNHAQSEVGLKVDKL